MGHSATRVDRSGILWPTAVAMAGEFVRSLTFTDISSQWTENRAIWNKSAAEVLGRVQEVADDGIDKGDTSGSLPVAVAITRRNCRRF